MLPGFSAPSWTDPLDAAARIAQTPEDASLRGVFFQSVLDDLQSHGKKSMHREHYSSFMRYPLREYMELAVVAARELHPDEPLRSALREIGRAVYPAFAATMAGSAIFAFGGNDFGKVAALAEKAYSISVTPGRVSLRQVGARHLVAELRDVFAFLDCLQIGIWEGAMIACRTEGTINVRMLSSSDADLEMHWR
jgi:uncharacterized protein (TIGR02265 family)